MGYDIQSIVAKKFKHYSNAAFENRFMNPELFSSTKFVYLHAYRCRTTNGNAISPGDNVAVVKRKRGIEVWAESHVIAVIEDEDAKDLIEAFRADPRACGCVMARVEGEVGVDGRFSIMLTEGGARVVGTTFERKSNESTVPRLQ